MADATENLRKYLLTSATIRLLVADRVHQNTVPESRAEAYIWLRKSSEAYEHHLNSAAGESPRAVYYDLECCATDIEQSTDIADGVRSLFPYAGAFGDTTVKAAFVNDADEDYIPINEMADEGIHVQALQLEVMP